MSKDARNLASLFTLLFLGCGDPGSDPGEPPTDNSAACHALIARPCDSGAIPSDVIAACQDLFVRRIAFAQRCTSPSVSASSVEEQVYVDSCAGIATAPGVTLTPLDIKACADQMDSSPCLGGNVFPSCTGYWGDMLYPKHDKKGSLAVGEPCFAQVQCESGYCDHGAFGSCGVCRRPRAEGESCGDAMDLCIVGSCREGTCQPDGKTLGEECTTHGIECQPALYCKQSKCMPRGQAGEPCDPSTYCADGLACLGGACVTLGADGAGCSDDAMCSSYWCKGGICTPRPTGLTEGEDCSVGFCRADLLCDEMKVCKAPTYLPEGAMCTSSSFPQVMCTAGLYCNETCSPGSGCQGACEPLPQPGEHCTALASCASGASCQGFDPTDLTKGVCVSAKLGAEGEACPCVGDLACVDGVCVAYGGCQ